MLSARLAAGSVRIEVEDIGEGIDPADLLHVFDRFWLADRSRSHGTGHGLGLSIARQLVRAHGGTIDVRSELGAGTVSTIDLSARR